MRSLFTASDEIFIAVDATSETADCKRHLTVKPHIYSRSKTKRRTVQHLSNQDAADWTPVAGGRCNFFCLMHNFFDILCCTMKPPRRHAANAATAIHLLAFFSLLVFCIATKVLSQEVATTQQDGGECHPSAHEGIETQLHFLCLVDLTCRHNACLAFCYIFFFSGDT